MLYSAAYTSTLLLHYALPACGGSDDDRRRVLAGGAVLATGAQALPRLFPHGLTAPGAAAAGVEAAAQLHSQAAARRHVAGAPAARAAAAAAAAAVAARLAARRSGRDAACQGQRPHGCVERADANECLVVVPCARSAAKLGQRCSLGRVMGCKRCACCRTYPDCPAWCSPPGEPPVLLIMDPPATRFARGAPTLQGLAACIQPTPSSPAWPTWAHAKSGWRITWPPSAPTVS